MNYDGMLISNRLASYEILGCTFNWACAGFYSLQDCQMKVETGLPLSTYLIVLDMTTCHIPTAQIFVFIKKLSQSCFSKHGVF